MKGSARQMLWSGVAAAMCMTPVLAGDPLRQQAQLGPVQVTVEVTPAEPRIGDVLSVAIRVTALPDVEVLMPEFGEALDQFEILDFVPRETLNDQGDIVQTQTYSLQLRRSGPQRIPPILVEFVDHRPGQKSAPDGEDAYELLTPRVDFNVESVVAADNAAAIRPALGDLDTSGGTRSIAERSMRGAILAAGAIVLGLVVTTIIVRRLRIKVDRVSPFEIAATRLNRLIQRPLPRGEQIEPFFVELSALVREYLENRFELRAPELTTEEFLEQASASGQLSSDHQPLLREFLRHADLVKFAGWHPDEMTIRQALSAAERFLQETRDEVGTNVFDRGRLQEGAETSDSQRVTHA
ncbi:MAG: hypothetical protein O3C60_00035 [Planctomycetota bacterium]|nr:hypothetical protein [Planctomycetota bacterium]